MNNEEVAYKAGYLRGFQVARGPFLVPPDQWPEDAWRDWQRENQSLSEPSRWFLRVMIEVAPIIGQSHEEWARDAIALADQLNCGLNATANEVKVSVFSGDTIEEVVQRYHHISQFFKK